MDDSSGADVVLENAERLLGDAQLLFEHGRYPTSAALAVLSIEEFGKAFRGMSVGHLAKQKAAVSFGLINHFVQHLKEHGLALQRIANTPEKQEANPRNPDLELRFEKVVDALNDSSWKKMRDQVSKKDLSTVKNRGFYVDLDSGGAAVGIPNQIDNVEAKRFIDIAAELLHAHKSLLDTLATWSAFRPALDEG
jgi:AbiV family abortive infection protein